MRLLKRHLYILIPFSLLYHLIISLRNILYNRYIFKAYSVDAKVISIGNITWGGTGKTPLTAWIGRFLLGTGHKVAILLRGYGKDEAGLYEGLAPGIPIFPGKDRISTGTLAKEKYSVDTVLLDDGFQYRRLKRDLEIVCIDAVNPFGSGWVIPFGIMREGFSSLRRADLFFITKVDLVRESDLGDLANRLKDINPDALIVKSLYLPSGFYTLPNYEEIYLDELKSKEVVLVSAIGNSTSFERTVKKTGLDFRKHFVFRDHHWYTGRDLEKIDRFCRRNNIDAVITTEKDAVRLNNLSHERWAMLKWLVLNVRLKIVENEKAFYDRLFGIYNS